MRVSWHEADKDLSQKQHVW